VSIFKYNKQMFLLYDQGYRYLVDNIEIQEVYDKE